MILGCLISDLRAPLAYGSRVPPMPARLLTAPISEHIGGCGPLLKGLEQTGGPAMGRRHGFSIAGPGPGKLSIGVFQGHHQA